MNGPGITHRLLIAGLIAGMIAGVSSAGQLKPKASAAGVQGAGTPQAAAPISLLPAIERRITLPDGHQLVLAADGKTLGLRDAGHPQHVRTYSLASRVLGASLTRMPSGRVLIWGGISRSGRLQSSGYWFDPDLNTLEAATDLPISPRAYHTATVLTDGTVLFAGGQSDVAGAERWDELQTTPTQTSELARRSNQSAELQADGRVRLHGGVDTAGRPGSVDILFDPVGGAFFNERLQTKSSRPTQAGLAASLPSQGATDVAPDARLSVRFTTPVRMSELNLSNVVLMGPGGAARIKVVPVEAGRLVFVAPEQSLFPDSMYTLMIDGVHGTHGAALPLMAIDFKTAALGQTSSELPSTTKSVKKEGNGPYLVTGSTVRSAAGCPQTGTAVALCRKRGLLTDGVWYPGVDNTHNRWRIYGPSESPKHDASLAKLASIIKVTTIRGRVVRVDQKPVAGVEVSTKGIVSTTNSDGWFMLVGVPRGHQELYVDGSVANRGALQYGQFVVGVDVVAGRMNEIPYLMHLPRITARDKIKISSPLKQDMVVGHPDMPGLELRIPKGTVIHDRKGRLVTELAIVPTPVNRAPFPVMENHPMAFTVEPGGAQIRGLSPSANGIRVYYPNYDGYAAGTRANFWIYDPVEGWRVYGEGTVSTDGRHVVPERGVALHQTMGGMFSVPSSTPPSEPDLPPDGHCCGNEGSGGVANTADPIDLKTGQFVYSETDIRISDVVPISLSRSYRPHDMAMQQFGMGTASNFNYYLYNPGGTYSSLDVVLPNGSFIQLDRVSGSGPQGEWRQGGSTTAYSGATLVSLYDAQQQPYGRAYRLTTRNGSVMQFGSYNDNRLTWMQDRYGNRTALVYDAGLVSQIVSSTGRSISIDYDSNNRIQSATDYTGRVWHYAYDSLGLLESVNYPDATSRQFTYKTTVLNGTLIQHRMESITDQRGTRVFLNEFEDLGDGVAGRVIKQTQADGGIYTIDYAHNAGTTTGVLVTQPDGSKRRVVFDANSPYPQTDTLGYGTPLAEIYQFERDPASGQITARIDPLGRRTEYQYNADGQVTQVFYLPGTSQERTVQLTYTVDGDLATVTDPLSRVTTLGYTGRCLTSVTNQLNEVTQIACNSAGQPISITDPLGHTTTLYYEGGELISVTDPLGRTDRFTYDALGRLISAKNPAGDITRQEHDVMDRVTKIVDAAGEATELGYDPNGNVLAVLLPNGNGITYDYDDRNRPTTRTDGLTQSEGWVYDTMDRVLSYTDRKSQVTAFNYDVLGRPTTTTYQDASIVTAGYDAGNRLRTLVDSVAGTLSWDYDDLDQLIQAVTAQGMIGYNYNAAGRRISMTAASQPTVEYQYDGADRLTRILQGSEVVQHTYDVAGRRLTTTLPNDVEAGYAYNDTNQLTGLAWLKPDNTLLGDLGYGYNGVGRLVAQTGSYAPQTLPTASTGVNAFDDNQRQIQFNGQALTYDTNGNLTGDGTRTYVWDARDQLAQIKQGATTIASFAYDAMGRRITRTEGGQATAYLYDGLDPVQETKGGIANPILTGLGIDERYARNDSGGRTYFLTDALGSTRALTDSSGVVVQRYDYTPYGQTSQTMSGFSNPYQYTGRERDANGLYYYRARYYSAGMGRFIAEDPIGLAGGLNTYAYVGGNPVSRIDPFGLTEWSGSSLSWSFFFASGATYQLRSKCQGGIAYWVEIRARGVSGGFIGVPITYVGSSVKFTDRNSTPDPNIFNGAWSQASGGASAPIGAGYTKTRLGDAKSNSGFGPQMGYEAGESAAVGTASVNWAIKVDCGCDG